MYWFKFTKNKQYMKEILCVIFYVSFVLCSFLYIHPFVQENDLIYNSSQLKMVTSTTSETIRKDYIDEDGNITIAADLGYATIIISQTCKGEIESYYDNTGKPIKKKYAEYYAISRKKDENGNVIQITYLDEFGNPTMTTGGYAEERIEINQNDQKNIIWFYDSQGEQTLTKYYGYGQIDEYDEDGYIYKKTYIDKGKKPMITGLGYAIVQRCYFTNEDNCMEGYEVYYDDKEKQVALELGQYGVYRRFDEYGRETVVTYLDENKQPTITKKGYTTIIKTYQANGQTESEKYYDQEGKPYALSEGQFGVKRRNNHMTYLNQNGDEMFSIRNTIYNYSWMVIPCTIFFVILSAISTKKRNCFFLILYLAVIVYMTLLYRDSIGTRHISVLHNITNVFNNNETRADIIKNIWLFIPLGAISYKIYPSYKIIFITMLFSIIIEITQFYFGIGFCELDDIISNSVGGCVGFYSGKLTNKLVRRIKF